MPGNGWNAWPEKLWAESFGPQLWVRAILATLDPESSEVWAEAYTAIPLSPTRRVPGIGIVGRPRLEFLDCWSAAAGILGICGRGFVGRNGFGPQVTH